MGFWIGVGLVGALVLLFVYDLLQRRHAVLRNFPVIGHLRYLLEAIGPELRQYIVTSNDEELPFSRDERSWVYASAKKENNYFGFGTDNDYGAGNHVILKHRTLALPPCSKTDELHLLPSPKVLGAKRGRAKAFRPDSVVNISGMSFGSLSAPAIEALNAGSALAKCLHNTGEGGIAPCHEKGGELVWQIGTGYFGCRDENGQFNLEQFRRTIEGRPVRAIEVKLSQGAKPGMGGILPAQKITPEIARIRGIPMGQDCLSPSSHSAFSDVDSMLDFVELLASETGLPVGIKSAVGEIGFWGELADKMARGDRGVDFITIDGGEGGTGAGPLVFTDHVSLPFKIGFSRVYRVFAERELQHDVTFIGSGKLGFPESASLAFALGCDLINVGREAMMAIGCIQAQRCHTGHCPTGVATQNRWLIRGLDPTHKAARLANYIVTLRKELHLVARACGVCHPALITNRHIEILDGRIGSRSLEEVFDYESDWGWPSDESRKAIEQLMGEE